MLDKNIIQRQIETEGVSIRAYQNNDKRYFEGYASIFTSRSKPIYENGKLFYEVIDPNAFNEVLNDPKLDVYLTFNHDRGRVMARTISGTLKLSVDQRGLKFIAEVPNVTYANDVYELVKRNDIFECSFAFYVKRGDDSWSVDEEGNNVRHVHKISRLIDVSLVTAGAYATTDVVARENVINVKKGERLILSFEQEEQNTETVDEVIENENDTPQEQPVKDKTDSKKRMQMYIELLKLKSRK